MLHLATVPLLSDVKVAAHYHNPDNPRQQTIALS
jgi:hypothetical protein